MNDALLRLVLIIIAAITIISGATQLIAGEFVLGILAAETSPALVHMFQTIGMFMVITGAMFLKTLLTRSEETAVPFWIAVQKLAAGVLVVMAWSKGYFLAITLGVAAFDIFTGILVFIFWRRLP